jgi:hypothetical protein
VVYWAVLAYVAPHQRRLCGTGTHMSLSPSFLFFFSGRLSLRLASASHHPPVPYPQSTPDDVPRLPPLPCRRGSPATPRLPPPSLLVVVEQGFGMWTTSSSTAALLGFGGEGVEDTLPRAPRRRRGSSLRPSHIVLRPCRRRPSSPSPSRSLQRWTIGPPPLSPI